MWPHMAQILLIVHNFQYTWPQKRNSNILLFTISSGKYQKTNMINWELFYLWWIPAKTGIYAKGSFQTFMLKDHFKSAKVL
jgi:hypothetical protein